ncbi:major facilitator superfamily protein, partial [Kipferlia bialata]|eukprot:g6870.t1
MKDVPFLGSMSHNGVVATLTTPFFSMPYNNVVVYFTMYLLELGITERQVGIYQTILMTTQILASLVSGHLADKYGREMTVLIFDMLSWTGADLFWALSDTLYGQIIGGILNGTNKVVYTSLRCLLTENATSPQRLANFSGFYFSLLFGGLFTPIGGWVIDTYGLLEGERYLLFASATMMGIEFLVRHFTWEKRPSSQKRPECTMSTKSADEDSVCKDEEEEGAAMPDKGVDGTDVPLAHTKEEREGRDTGESPDCGESSSTSGEQITVATGVSATEAPAVGDNLRTPPETGSVTEVDGDDLTGVRPCDHTTTDDGERDVNETKGEIALLWTNMRDAFSFFMATPQMRLCFALSAGVTFYVVFKPLFYYDYLVKSVGLSEGDIGTVGMVMAATQIAMLLLVVPRVPTQHVTTVLSIGLMLGAIALGLLVVLSYRYSIFLLVPVIFFDAISIAVMRPMADTLWSDMLDDD